MTILALDTAATDKPVTLAEVKAALRISTSDDDTMLDLWIAAATDYVDGPNGLLGKAIVQQTWTQSQRLPGTVTLDLKLLPVISISEITYFDADNVSQSLTVSDFDLVKSEDWAYLKPKSGVSWPTTYDRDDALTVKAVIGFGDQAAAPAAIKAAVMMLVGAWYQNPEATTVGTLSSAPLGFNELINSKKIGWVGA